MKKLLILLAIVAMYLTACVPAKQYNDLKRKSEICEADLSRMSAENLAYTTKNKELELQIAQLNDDIDHIKSEMSDKTNVMKKLQADYDVMSENYNRTLTESSTKLKTKDDETKKVLGKLQLTQQELFKMQDELNAKKKSLDEATAALQAREAKVAELQKILNEKDSAASALRKKVTDALIGFNNNGLTIQQRNGKVYVSMEEKLLFASGSTEVDKKGVEALKQLAKVLEENKDINVMVEGHTDNVPIAGGPIKDNWDLSVLRATSVTKIMLSSAKINSTRIVPSGRGEYVPVAKNDNAENKRKNRRIEVILTPKLDEILKVLEN
ncbi:MAG: OmpA family protein [Bacteroidia bacterium]